MTFVSWKLEAVPNLSPCPFCAMIELRHRKSPQSISMDRMWLAVELDPFQVSTIWLYAEHWEGPHTSTASKDNRMFYFQLNCCIVFFSYVRNQPSTVGSSVRLSISRA